jgi:hypothetical protein
MAIAPISPLHVLPRLPREERAPELPSMGSVWGQALGKGLGGALETLASTKVQRMQQDRQAAVLESLGLNPQAAYLPAPLQQDYLRGQYQMQSQALRALGGPAGQQQTTALSDYYKALRGEQIAPQLMAPSGSQQMVPQFSQEPQRVEEPPTTIRPTEFIEEEAEVIETPPQKKARVSPGGIDPVQVAQDYIAKTGLSDAQAKPILDAARREQEQLRKERAETREEERLTQRQREVAAREAQAQAREESASAKGKAEYAKFYQPMRIEAKESAQEAQTQAQGMMRVADLSRKGELPEKSIVALANLHPFLTPLLGASGEEAQKIIQQQMRGVGKEIKGKVSNMELEAYMKKFPSLWNSPDGVQLLSQLITTENLSKMAYDKMLEKAYLYNESLPAKKRSYNVDSLANKWMDPVNKFLQDQTYLGPTSLKKINGKPIPEGGVVKKRGSQTKGWKKSGYVWIPVKKENEQWIANLKFDPSIINMKQLQKWGEG